MEYKIACECLTSPLLRCHDPPPPIGAARWACLELALDLSHLLFRGPAFQMPKKGSEYKRHRGRAWEAVFTHPCSAQLCIQGPRKPRTALSGTHAIQQALRPATSLFTSEWPAREVRVSCQPKTVKNLHLQQVYGQPSSPAKLAGAPRQEAASPWELALAIEGGDRPSKGLAGGIHVCSIQLRWAELGK